MMLGVSALASLIWVASVHAAGQDLKRHVQWNIPAGNVWQTLEIYRAQAGAITELRCNYCSGPQPCSSYTLSTGACVPQCPGPEVPPHQRMMPAGQGCSLACEELDSVTTNAVIGEFLLTEALARMLKGTGLTFAVMTRTDREGLEVALLDARRHFDIAGGPMNETSVTFARQSGVRVAATSNIFERTHTRAVHGHMTPEEALHIMLRDSGLEYLRAPPAEVSSASASSQGLGDSVLVRESLPQVLIEGGAIRSGMEAVTAPQVQEVEQPQLKRAPFATVQDAIQSLPVSVLGGMREAFDRDDNVARGTAVNLRGLGPGATLVLIDGHRQPSSGMDGNFVDVSTIPWAAVERIDVLPDGASATYGAGAIGGVVNIIMRKDTEGAETRLRSSDVRGGANERVASQLVAHKWASGTALFAYQYSEREALPISSRDYARDTDKRPFGGDDFSSSASNPGTILDPITLLPAYAIPKGQNGKSLAVHDLIAGANRFNWQATRDLLPARKAHSAYSSWSQRLDDQWTLNGDARVNTRHIELTEFAQSRQLNVPSLNAYFVSPFDTPTVLVDYNFLQDLGPQHREGFARTIVSSISLSGTLTRDWDTNFTLLRGQEHLNTLDRNLLDDVALGEALADSNPITAFNPFGDGTSTAPETLERIRNFQHQSAISKVTEFSATTHARFASWRSGSLQLSAGADYRVEELAQSLTSRHVANVASFERTSRSTFAELSAPVATGLDLSLAGRFEAFAYTGSAFAPKIALRWQPLARVSLRGTWGRSYRPPDLLDLDVTDYHNAVGFLPIPDPQSPSGQSLGLIRVGGNPTLQEETARAWTAGLDFSSHRMSTSFSLTYFSIDYRDRVIVPGPIPQIFTLLHEDEWANIVTRNPSRAAIDEICRSPHFFGSASDCLASPPGEITIIDARARNGGDTHASGFDWVIEQPLDLSTARLLLRASGTHLLRFDLANGSALPAAGLLASIEYPPRARIQCGLDWHQHAGEQPGVSAGLAASYVSGFRDTRGAAASRAISSSIQVDANVTYRTTRSDGWIGDLDLMLNVTNIANEAPPFVNRPLGFDEANADPYGRIVSFSIQKRF